MFRPLTLLVLLASLCVSTVGCLVPGQRLLQARIEQDGKLLLQTSFGVSDSWDAATAWRVLDGREFDVEDQEAVATSRTESGPLALRGKIRIVLLHVDRTFASAEVSQLQLVPGTVQAGTWQLAPGEVERTLRAINTQAR